MLRGLIERRDSERYEAILFRAGGQDDAVWRSMADASDKTMTLPRDLAGARAMIAAEELDLLIYTDIAADPFTYFLAFSRLARVQAATWGHADTSGIPAIDHYISWREWEPAGASAQYSERLILMAHPPTCFAAPATVPNEIGRAALGIEEGASFYFCPHNVVKFHPEFDAILADLLTRDPRGIVAIPEGHVAAWTDVLKRRLAQACGDNFARLRFIARMPHADFLGAVRLADALLDPLHFCGGITSLEAFAVGCPIVTLPGAIHARAHDLRLLSPHAPSRSGCSRADRLCRDRGSPCQRSGMAPQQRAAIVAKAPILFDDIAAVREFEAVTGRAVAKAYPAQPPRP